MLPTQNAGKALADTPDAQHIGNVPGFVIIHVWCLKVDAKSRTPFAFSFHARCASSVYRFGVCVNDHRANNKMPCVWKGVHGRIENVASQMTTATVKLCTKRNATTQSILSMQLGQVEGNKDDDNSDDLIDDATRCHRCRNSRHFSHTQTILNQALNAQNNNQKYKTAKNIGCSTETHTQFGCPSFDVSSEVDRIL